MAEQRTGSSRNVASPLVVALRLALEEIAERQAAEKAERRRNLRVVDGKRRVAA